MQTDKPFSEQESLLLIESMINKARNQFNENGHLYLLWGWVVLVCSVGQFVLQVIGYAGHYRVWLLIWVAVVYQVVYLVRKKKHRKVHTYTDSILANVWLAFAITMILVGFQGGIGGGAQPASHVNATFLALYGIPTFVSGTILKFNPLKIGASLCWILAAMAPFVPSRYYLLMLGLAVIAAWIVPGYLLQRRYEQQQFT